jgi:transposase
VRIIPRMDRAARRRLIARGRVGRDPATLVRFQVVAGLAAGRSHREVADQLAVATGLVGRVKKRYLDGGIAALADGRRMNGVRKLTPAYLTRLREVLARTPEDFGWQRPTWTRELLAIEMGRQGCVMVSVCVLGRALRRIGARLGRPKPIVRCPWPAARRKRRIRWLKRLAANATDAEPVLYVDEIDIHLNPKIGRDWMLRGTQRRIMTPGKNEKFYLAGALDVRRRRIVYTGEERKNSALFIGLLDRIVAAYPRARTIHLILDNYIIHKSNVAAHALDALAGRVRLHFLPPYCPDANRIERLWQDLHANVTRNHRCTSLDELLARVRDFLRAYNNDPALCSLLRAAA